MFKLFYVSFQDEGFKDQIHRIVFYFDYFFRSDRVASLDLYTDIRRQDGCVGMACTE